MFVPDEYRLRDCALALALAREIRTGTLITAADGRTDASHLPFLVESGMADPGSGRGGRLIGHVDRRNRQWRALETNPGCTVAFLGPQAHVSPAWYATRPRAPTWLYVAVHVRGRATLVADPAALRRMVEQLSAELEPAGSPWRSDQIVPYTERLMPFIVGFSIEIEQVEAQLRLGQTNTPEDRARVLAGLEAGQGAAPMVAALIRRLVPPPPA